MTSMKRKISPSSAPQRSKKKVKKTYHCDRKCASGSACGKEFTSTSHLRNHVDAVHDKRRDHKCDKAGSNGKPCGKAFGFRSALLEHIRNIHGQGTVVHACTWKDEGTHTVCGKELKSPLALTKHIASVHKGLR